MTGKLPVAQLETLFGPLAQLEIIFDQFHHFLLERHNRVVLDGIGNIEQRLDRIDRTQKIGREPGKVDLYLPPDLVDLEDTSGQHHEE